MCEQIIYFLNYKIIFNVKNYAESHTYFCKNTLHIYFIPVTGIVIFSIYICHLITIECLYLVVLSCSFDSFAFILIGEKIKYLILKSYKSF